MKTKPPPGWPRTLREIEGRKVRTAIMLATGVVRIPKDTIMTIGETTRWDGIVLHGELCKHCGVTPFIRGVSPRDLELLGIEEST